MIELADVSFRYPGQRVPALVGVSFTVAAGARFALLGVNGSGKTTLLTLLAGLRTPAAGTVRIAGFDLATRRREAQQRVAFVPQENAFYPTLTVAENLAFFAAMREVPSALRAGRIRDAVEVTVLGSLLSQRAGTLSGGQRRRLSIAGGLLGAPELLLLDEPTAGVDPEVRAQLVASIREIAERGTTLVYCSHHLDEVDALCTDVALLDAGRLRF
ncbi:MAG: ABC transporter ATP-binding protein, partial [Gemmatimonadaceae bacterium]|nr:ABC transporter ATP-binding protein [Gemmatimonadaceae bacterium]